MGDSAPFPPPTRRGFLGMTAGAAGSVLLVGCTDPSPSENGFRAGVARATPYPEVAPDKALNTVLALEHQAIHAYGAVMPLLTPSTRGLAGGFLRDHQAHRDALRARLVGLGASPVTAQPSYDLGSPPPADEASALTAAAGLEELAARTYYAMLAGSSDPALLQFLASIMGDEAQHAAVLLAATGKPPVPASFAGSGS